MRAPLSLGAAPVIPHTQLRRRTEHVIDARICVLSGCPKLQRTAARDGRLVASCAADVFKAQLPVDLLEETVRANPSAVPGHDADHNPLLLRLLMSPSCVRPECGVAQIEHAEKVLVADPADAEEDLFA